MELLLLLLIDLVNTVTCLNDYRRGFGLVIRFENLQMLTTSITLSVIHAPVFSLQCEPSPFVCYIFTSRCLVATFNGGRSPHSAFPKYPRATATSF
jgi:hypothetical protein